MPASIWTPFFEEIKGKKKRDDVRKREVERSERERDEKRILRRGNIWKERGREVRERERERENIKKRKSLERE
jgi:hypothetical protein